MKIKPLTPIARFWSLLKPDSKDIKGIYVYAIFSGLIALSLPIGIQAIINLIQGGRVNTAWLLLVIFVVAGVFIAGVLRILQLRLTENIQQKIFARSAFDFAYRIPRLRMEALYKHYAPELVNRFFDTLAVQKGLSKILIDFTSALLQVVFGLALLSFYHPFFIVFSLILVLLVVAIFRYTAKRGLDTSLDESKHKYKMVYWLEEVARTTTTFKLAGKTELPLFRTNKHVDKYLNARESHFRVLVSQYWLLVIFKVLVATGLLAIGSILVMDQLMNIGQFVAAEIIIILVMNSVEKLILSLETFYDILTALEKIGEVADMELEKTTGEDLAQTVAGNGLAVEITNATFSYPQSQAAVLKNINLKIKAGEKVAILGKNGSGKSTVLSLLAGMYSVSKGSISFNDLPIGNLNLDSLRSLTGNYLSDEQLFEGTILENITLGRPNLCLADAQLAIEEVALSDFIKTQTLGYDTILYPQGNQLARSVVQRLLMARSIVHKPRLLLVEDKFNSTDSHGNYPQAHILLTSKLPATVVVATSNPLVAQLADRVAIIDDGTIVFIGSYVEASKIFQNL